MGRSVTLLSLLFVLVFLDVSSTHAFNVSLKDAYVFLGHPFWWACLVNNDDQSTSKDWSFHWRFEDDIVVVGGGENDGVVRAMDNGTLYFQEVKEENIGSYTCVVSDGQIASETKAFLRKAYLTKPIITNPPDQSVQIGDRAAFQCKVDAKPEASITWFHDDNVVTVDDDVMTSRSGDGDFTLQLHEVTYKDVGVYKCVVGHALLDQPLHSDGMRLQVFGEPFIIVGLKPSSYPVGYNISIPCRVESNPEANVVWRFGPSSTAPNATRSPTSSPMSTFTLSKDDPLTNTGQSVVSLNDEGDLILITNATEELSGLYSCSWSNQFGTAESNATITISGSPEVPEFLETPKNQDIVESSELRLHCAGKGNPSVKVSWIFPKGSGENLKELDGDVNESYFVVKEVTQYDGGVYTCVISNGEGMNSVNTTVNVLFKPDFVITPPLSINAKRNTVLEIPCKAEGNPAPTIKWNLPWTENEIITSSKYSVNSISFNDSSLVINNVQDIHDGMYRCIASNEIGSVSVSAKIYVIRGPVIIKSLTSVGVTEGDEVLLQCDVKSYQPLKVDWFYKHLLDPSLQAINIQKTLEMVSGEHVNMTEAGLVKIEPDKNTGLPESSTYTDKNNDVFTFYLQIRNIKEADAGIYVCRVENDEGAAHTFGVVRVITFPEFTITPSDTKVLPGSDVALHCHSVGIPVPSQRWLYKGGKLILNSRIVMDSNGSLSISNIREGEIGIYTCLATNQAGQRSVSAKLSMSSKPRLVNAPSNQTFLEYERGSLNCEGYSDLPFSVLWYESDRDGNRINLVGKNVVRKTNSKQEASKNDIISLSGGDENTNIYIDEKGSLVFECIEKLHQTWYLCELKNQDGSVQSEPIFVQVETLPKATSLTVSDPNAIEGDDIELRCSVDGLTTNFNGKISWVSPQYLEITDSGNTFFPEISVESEKITSSVDLPAHYSVLKIKEVDNARHGGSWWCKVCNIVGCSVRKITMTVVGKPIVRAISSAIEENEISIKCLSYGNPKPDITYLSNDLGITNNTEGHRVSNKSLIIDDQRLQTKYSCEAMNIHGVDKKTFDIPTTPIITSVIPGQTSLEVKVMSDMPSAHVSLIQLLLEYKQSGATSEWKTQSYQINGDLMEYLNVFKDVRIENVNKTCREYTDDNSMQYGNDKPIIPNDGLKINIDSSDIFYRYSFQSLVKNLAAYTLYSVRASAVNALGPSIPSESVNVMTLPSAPSAVTNIEASVKNTSCTLTWKNPKNLNGDAKDIEIKIQISHQFINNIVNSMTLSAAQPPTVELNGLSVGKYFAEITPHNKKINTSGQSSNFQFLIQDQAPNFIPQITEIRSITHASVTIIWTTPNNPTARIPPVTGYLLLLKITDTKSNDLTIQIDNGHTSNHTVQKLREHQEYSIQIASTNQAGASPYSPPELVTTRFAAFSEKALGMADIQGYSISWSLIAIVLISAGAALLFFTGFLVFSYQFRLTKRGSVDITPEPSYDFRNNGSQEGQGHSRVLMDSFQDTDFILY